MILTEEEKLLIPEPLFGAFQNNFKINGIIETFYVNKINNIYAIECVESFSGYQYGIYNNRSKNIQDLMKFFEIWYERDRKITWTSNNKIHEVDLRDIFSPLTKGIL